MNKFITLVKKELRELVTIQMLAPLIAVVAIFMLIGNVVNKETQKSVSSLGFAVTDLDHSVASQETLTALETIFSGNSPVIEASSINEALSKAKQENASGLLEIPSGFGQGLSGGQQQKLGVYSIISDLSLTQSRKSQIISQASAAVNSYFSNKLITQSSGTGKALFLKSPVITDEFVIVGDRMANVSFQQVSSYISSQTFFLPIILFMVIVIASQLVAMTIATEKENKTLETLLSMPIGRKSIVIAKLTASAVVALLSAGIYLYGFNHYISSISGPASVATAGVQSAITALGLNFSVGGYILLGISLFLGILAALSIALVLGAFAEDAKSVQGVTTPMMILVFIPYLLTLLIDINTASPLLRYIVYIIPFSHSFLASSNILFHHYLLYILGNIYLVVFFLFFVYLASKIFSSDKVLTLKLKLRLRR